MRTGSRVIGAWSLGVALLIIALHDAVASPGTILVFGDSLSAAFGIRPEQGWVALLAQRLKDQGYGYGVVNASVSGETTAGGRERLPRALELHRPQVVILELGANDGLRGLPLDVARDNLAAMVQLAQAAGARVLLVGILLPPNYGERYTRQLAQLYPELAGRLHVPLVPFLLQKVALDPALMQADGVHPNAAAQPTLLETVWSQLMSLLDHRHARSS